MSFVRPAKMSPVVMAQAERYAGGFWLILSRIWRRGFMDKEERVLRSHVTLEWWWARM